MSLKVDKRELKVQFLSPKEKLRLENIIFERRYSNVFES
nr:MAG TPA: hypothetical protein [Caudoviricetes sp.]